MTPASNTPFLSRTPWRTRLIVWPGMPFRTLPFPYLFHRWDVRDPDHGWVGSYFMREAAVVGLREWVEIKHGL